MEVLKYTGLLKSIVARFHGYDQEELLNEAIVLALQAMRSYDSSKGTTIETWIGTIVHNGIYAIVTNKTKATAFRPPESREDIEFIREREFDLNKVLIEVSDNARVAILLALEKKPDRYGMKRLLRALEWSTKRIKEVYAEIQEVLYEMP